MVSLSHLCRRIDGVAPNLPKRYNYVTGTLMHGCGEIVAVADDESGTEQHDQAEHK
jgi:hypothetical protein